MRVRGAGFRRGLKLFQYAGEIEGEGHDKGSTSRYLSKNPLVFVPNCRELISVEA